MDFVLKLPERIYENKDETMDYDSEMTRLSRELEELLKEESNSTDILIKLMKELDYEIRL